MGGSTLYIETLGQKVKEAGTGGGLEVTGNLGDVMKESIRIAGTFARVFLEQSDESNTFFADNKYIIYYSKQYNLYVYFTGSTCMFLKERLLKMDQVLV